MTPARELIGRAHELKPVVASRAAATERNRAMLDETIQDMADAGFLQVLTPARFGGHELPLDVMVEIGRVLATGCPSTGWVTSFYMGHNWLHAIFPERFQREVFADGPFTLSSGQIAPTIRAIPVAGGYEISGRSAWSSGVPHARWIFLTGMVTADDGSRTPLMFCVPRNDVEVIDTWFIAGMQGTGSLDIEVEKVFVPEYRTLPVALLAGGERPGQGANVGSLYRLPAMAVLGYATVAVLAGMLRGAAEAFKTITVDRIASHTGAAVATKPAAHMRLGRAFATADAVDALLRDGVTRAAALDGPAPPGVGTRAGIKMHGALITKTVCDTINDIAHGAGGNSFRDDQPLQRFFRDANVVRTHAALDIEPVSELYGRTILGLDPGAPV